MATDSSCRERFAPRAGERALGLLLAHVLARERAESPQTLDSSRIRESASHDTLSIEVADDYESKQLTNQGNLYEVKYLLSLDKW